MVAQLAGGVGMRVPRPVPIGAVANGLIVDVDPLPCCYHPAPGEAVWTWMKKKI